MSSAISVISASACQPIMEAEYVSAYPSVQDVTWIHAVPLATRQDYRWYNCYGSCFDY
jgi:hypothetical protein